VLRAHGLGDAEVLREVVLLQQVGVPRHHRERRVELWPGGERQRGTDFRDDQLTQLFLMGDQPFVQLPQATHAEVAVGRPGRRVEGAPRRGNCAVGVVERRVRCRAQHLRGGGVDGLERAAALGVHQLTVDQ